MLLQQIEGPENGNDSRFWSGSRNMVITAFVHAQRKQTHKLMLQTCANGDQCFRFRAVKTVGGSGRPKPITGTGWRDKHVRAV